MRASPRPPPAAGAATELYANWNLVWQTYERSWIFPHDVVMANLDIFHSDKSGALIFIRLSCRQLKLARITMLTRRRF